MGVTLAGRPSWRHQWLVWVPMGTEPRLHWATAGPKLLSCSMLTKDMRTAQRTDRKAWSGGDKLITIVWSTLSRRYHVDTVHRAWAIAGTGGGSVGSRLTDAVTRRTTRPTGRRPAVCLAHRTDGKLLRADTESTLPFTYTTNLIQLHQNTPDNNCRAFTARYSYTNSVCQSVRPSVRLSNTGIVSNMGIILVFKPHRCYKLPREPLQRGIKYTGWEKTFDRKRRLSLCVKKKTALQHSQMFS